MMMGGSRDAAKRPAAVADQQKAGDDPARCCRPTGLRWRRRLAALWTRSEKRQAETTRAQWVGRRGLTTNKGVNRSLGVFLTQGVGTKQKSFSASDRNRTTTHTPRDHAVDLCLRRLSCSLRDPKTLASHKIAATQAAHVHAAAPRISSSTSSAETILQSAESQR